MSRKRPVILGPDGRPYVAPKAARPAPAPKPEPAPGVADEVHEWTFRLGAIDVSRYLTDIGRSPFGSFRIDTAAAKKPALADAVARDVDALTADFEGAGGVELPRPKADLTTYADAFDSARRKCPHENTIDMTYARREVYCEDCRQYVKRPRGLFG